MSKKVMDGKYLGFLSFLAFSGCLVLPPPINQMIWLSFLAPLSLLSLIPRDPAHVKQPLLAPENRFLNALGWLIFLCFLFSGYRGFSWFAYFALFSLYALGRNRKRLPED